MFQLVDESTARRYLLTGLIKEIGRTSECDVCLGDDEKVSRQHARLDWDGAAWNLVDLGSTNGTRVNGKDISEQRLQPGDRVEIGETTLLYQWTPVHDAASKKRITEVVPAADPTKPKRR